MKRMVDASDYQAGLQLDTVASSVDGAWFKAGDWSWVARYGWPADDLHDAAIARFAQLGKPVGSYFFVRPGSTAPATQIDGWAQHAPKGLTIKPMIDLEVSSISGSSLRDWIIEAIHLATDRFGAQPVLYWSHAFATAHGMTAPDAAHIPMVAEYHYGYRTFTWADRANWEATAYRAFGGPDVPPGYSGVSSTDLIWQFTSSAEIPGMPGLVDCDLVPDAAWALLTDSVLPPASVDDIEAIMADPALSARLAEFLRVFGEPGGPHYLADVWNNAAADHPMTEALYHHVTDGDRLLKMAGQLDNVQQTTWATHWQTGNMDVAPGTESQTIASQVRQIAEEVDKLALAGVDAGKLAAALVEAVLDRFAPKASSPVTSGLAVGPTASTPPDELTEGVELEVSKMTKVAPGAGPTDQELDDAVARRRAAEARRRQARASREASKEAP